MEKKMVVSARYMQLPVSYTADKQWVDIRHGDLLVSQFDARLSNTPDAFFPLDLQAYVGREVTLQADMLPDGLVFEDTLRDVSCHPLRPRIHFTSRFGWLNDPNGLFYYDGIYHLFYQHNPYGTDWGNMHWGHAVSHDLLSFEEVGDTLFPDEEGTIFSGSAFVDNENRSGLKKGEHPPILLFYTSAGNSSPQNKGKPFTVRAALSTDGGRCFEKLGPSLLPNMEMADRDPKVVWVPEMESYVLALYKDGQGSHRYALYKSTNLLDWSEFQSVDLVPDWECPDLIALNVDGDPQKKRWVFWGACGYYRVGRFKDGLLDLGEAVHINTRFQQEPILYAAQTFNNTPMHGEALQFSWMRCPTEGAPFNMQMGFPCILGLTQVGQEEVLTFRPADCALDGFPYQMRLQDITAENLNAQFDRAAIDVGVAKLKIPDAPFSLHIGDISISYKNGEIDTPMGHYAINADNGIDLTAVVDGDLLELYLQNGVLVLAGRPQMQSKGKKWRFKTVGMPCLHADLFSLDKL